MSEITLNIEGNRVKVDQSFLKLTPEEQNATVEEIAGSLAPQQTIMGNLNRGIADVFDAVNPFNGARQALNSRFGTDLPTDVSAREALPEFGIDVAQGEADGTVNSFARGMGEAAAVAPLAATGAGMLTGVRSIVGSVADDAYRTLTTGRGMLAEMLAGGGAQAGEDLAEDAGAPEWAQLVAGIAGGAGVASVPAIAQRTPTALGARKLSNTIKTAALPYTEAGGREVARQRVQELAGGEERAGRLAEEIGPSEIGLTPAQQTGDKNLIALEQEAARQSPKLREALDIRANDAQQIAGDSIRGMGGDPAAAQAFFEERRRAFREQITGVVDRVTSGALRPRAQNTETANSEEVVEALKGAYSAAREQGAALWGRVPNGTQVGTQDAKRVAQTLIGATPRAQRNDIPRVVQELLGKDSNSAFGEFETVSEMHGLYSELRRIARSAMAGTDQNRNKARIANDVADAILDDLGAGARQTEAARAIDTARAFSAEMHQTFTQGTVGRILKQSVDGDAALDPALALERTVGRGGSTGTVAIDDIQAATGSTANSQIEDFLRNRFEKATTSPEGKFKKGGGLRFMRDHAEVLQRFPHLRDVFGDALKSQSMASNAQARANRVLTDAENPAKSALTAFTQLPPEDAAHSVFKAKRPALQARKLAATARKDKTGEALDGLKGALADHVIRNAKGTNGLNGDELLAFVSKPEHKAALKAVFSDGEITQLRVLGNELIKLRKGRQPAGEIGSLSPRSPNRIIEMAARIVAANQGAKAGSGGASIQTAQMASGRVKALLGGLQNDKAEQILVDAITDPALFRLLLVDTGRVNLKPKDIGKLAPYFVGTGAALAVE